MAKSKKRKRSKPVWVDSDDRITPAGQNELYKRMKKLRKIADSICKDFDDDTCWLTDALYEGIESIESHYCIEDR